MVARSPLSVPPARSASNCIFDLVRDHFETWIIKKRVIDNVKKNLKINKFASHALIHATRPHCAKLCFERYKRWFYLSSDYRSVQHKKAKIRYLKILIFPQDGFVSIS